MEDKKLPQEALRAALGKADDDVERELSEFSTTPTAEIKADPTLPAAFKDEAAIKNAVEGRIGAPVKKMVYGPFGQMMHDGAQEFLKEHDPVLWARLQKDKFGS